MMFQQGDVDQVLIFFPRSSAAMFLLRVLPLRIA
jgi:hypothetical protein